MHPYAAHSDFVRPAWPARQLWRVIVMMIAFEVVFYAGARYLEVRLLLETNELSNEENIAWERFTHN